MKALMRKNSENLPINKNGAEKKDFQSADEMAEYFLKALEGITKLKKSAENAQIEMEYAVESKGAFEGDDVPLSVRGKREFNFDPGIVFTGNTLTGEELELLRKKLDKRSLDSHRRQRLKREGIQTLDKRARNRFLGISDNAHKTESYEIREENPGSFRNNDLPRVMSDAYKKDARRYNYAFHRY